MLKSLEENYNLFVDFDTINYKVIVREKRFGANNGLRFEYGKYLTGVTQEINTDEVINYVQGQDGDSVGFADSSWSGDNYVENYDYLLDGATWTPSGGLQGGSRWLSAGLALELAKIKYYQELYKDEFLGNENLNIEGLIHIRQRLLNEIALKEIDIQETEPMIDYYEQMLTSYLGESLDQQILLDKGAQATVSRSVIGLVDGSTYNISTSVSVSEGTPTSSDTNIAINAGNLVKFKSFYIEGSTISELLSPSLKQGKIRYDYQTSIKITFKNTGQVVKTKALTFLDVNRNIPFDEVVEATHFDIEIYFNSNSTGLTSNGSYSITNISIFEEDVENVTVYY